MSGSPSVSCPTVSTSRPNVQIADRLAHAMGLCAEIDAQMTVFATGEFAEASPGILRDLVAAGHEVGTCGWSGRVFDAPPIWAFREDVRRAKAAIESATGAPVVGFRAPGAFRRAAEVWPIDVLLEEGFRYDSSRPGTVGRGWAPTWAATRAPHFVRRPSGELLELPISSVSFPGTRLRLGAGPWSRVLPTAFVSGMLASHGRRDVAAVLDLDVHDLPSGSLPNRITERVRALGRAHRFTSAVARYHDLWAPAMRASVG